MTSPLFIIVYYSYCIEDHLYVNHWNILIFLLHYSMLHNTLTYILIWYHQMYNMLSINQTVILLIVYLVLNSYHIFKWKSSSQILEDDFFYFFASSIFFTDAVKTAKFSNASTRQHRSNCHRSVNSSPASLYILCIYVYQCNCVCMIGNLNLISQSKSWN